MIISIVQNPWVSRQHLLLALVLAVYVSSNSVIAGDTHAKQSAVEMDHGDMKHGSMKHNEIDVSTWPQTPSLTLTAHKDAMSGWNLQIEPSNFNFAPQRVNQANVVGEGHAHLYINGEKITRLYSNWFYLNNLKPGVHSVKVELNANNHGPLVLRGQKVSATTELVQHADLDSASGGVVAMTKGGRIQIPISDAAIAESRLGSDVQIKIIRAPIEGVVFVDSKANTITYQHGGTSIKDDQFTYAIEHEGALVTPPTTLTFSFRINNAGIRITSPSNGFQITGDKIVVEYEIFGSDYNHVHISHNQKTDTIEDVTGVYTITDVDPGVHVVSVELANEQHRVINSRKATDSISINVVE